jgi:hypothetical protein
MSGSTVAVTTGGNQYQDNHQDLKDISHIYI